MVGLRSITLLGMIAAAVTSSPANLKRGSTTETVIFRTDLQSEAMGQSDRWKDLLLSTQANDVGGYDITFVTKCEKDLAAGAVIRSKGIPLTVNTTGSTGSTGTNGTSTTSSYITKYMNIGRSTTNPAGKQPVGLVDQPNRSEGMLYVSGQKPFQELKLGSVKPEWNTWIICDGDTHPVLSWIGVVPSTDAAGRPILQANLPPPSEECSPVRLFVMTFAELEENLQGQC